jgi:hypothetical protein
MIPTVKIWDIDFSRLNLQETVKLICAKVKQNEDKFFHLITVNPEVTINPLCFFK